MQLISVMLIVSILIKTKATCQPNYDDPSDMVTKEDYGDYYEDDNESTDHHQNQNIDGEKDDSNNENNENVEMDEDYEPENNTNTDDDDDNTKSRPESIEAPESDDSKSHSRQDSYQSLMVKVYRGPTQTINKKPFASWSYFVQYPTDKS